MSRVALQTNPDLWWIEQTEALWKERNDKHQEINSGEAKSLDNPITSARWRIEHALVETNYEHCLIGSWVLYRPNGKPLKNECLPGEVERILRKYGFEAAQVVAIDIQRERINNEDDT